MALEPFAALLIAERREFLARLSAQFDINCLPKHRASFPHTVMSMFEQAFQKYTTNEIIPNLSSGRSKTVSARKLIGPSAIADTGSPAKDVHKD